MRGHVCWLVVAAVVLSPAEVIDRVAVKVGRSVITESAVLLEIHLTAFLNGNEPDFSPANKRKTAERMVDQTLIRHEMEVSQYPMPNLAETVPLLDQIKSERFSGEPDYRRALQKYKIDEDQLKKHLLKQLATLRFIDIRFRPGVQIPEKEIQEYYEKRFLPEWHNKSTDAAPSLDEVRKKIEEILIGERVDRLVENWLKETRARTRIEFIEKAFE